VVFVLLVVREGVHIWQRGFVKWCARCWFWVYKSRIKENLKRVAWELDVGHEDRTTINLSCLHLP